MSESIEASNVVRELKPFEVAEFCIESEVEGRHPFCNPLSGICIGCGSPGDTCQGCVDMGLVCEVGESPVGKARDQLECFVSPKLFAQPSFNE